LHGISVAGVDLAHLADLLGQRHAADQFGDAPFEQGRVFG
jgi:hypothetical protein